MCLIKSKKFFNPLKEARLKFRFFMHAGVGVIIDTFKIVNL